MERFVRTFEADEKLLQMLDVLRAKIEKETGSRCTTTDLIRLAIYFTAAKWNLDENC